jgi:hypothetical protein
MFPLPNRPRNWQQGFGQDRFRTGLRIKTWPFVISVVAKTSHKSYYHRHMKARQQQLRAEATNLSLLSAQRLWEDSELGT